MTSWRMPPSNMSMRPGAVRKIDGGAAKPEQQRAREPDAVGPHRREGAGTLDIRAHGHRRRRTVCRPAGSRRRRGCNPAAIGDGHNWRNMRSSSAARSDSDCVVAASEWSVRCTSGRGTRTNAPGMRASDTHADQSRLLFPPFGKPEVGHGGAVDHDRRTWNGIAEREQQPPAQARFDRTAAKEGGRRQRALDARVHHVARVAVECLSGSVKIRIGLRAAAACARHSST